MKSTCATNLPGFLLRRPGHLPDVPEEGDHGPLGEVPVYDGFGSPTTEADLPPRFAFRSLEPDTSVSLFAAQTRSYNPTAGRWEERDPIGFAAGDANLYLYVNTEARGILLNEDGTIRDA
jgi:RHS repeat-associated protein